MLRSRGMNHHAALRKLAKCWIRFLFQVWKTRTPYNLKRRLQRLRQTNHSVLKFLDPAPTTT